MNKRKAKKLRKKTRKTTFQFFDFYSQVLPTGPEDNVQPSLPPPPKKLLLSSYSSSRDPGVFFGFIKGKAEKKYVGKPMGDDAHIIIVGGSGQGKTQGIVIPTMATWGGSQVILDVKGELVSIHHQMHEGGNKRRILFAPEQLQDSCRYDPFAALRHGGRDDLAGNAMSLANTLIPKSPNSLDPVWTNTAQVFLASALLYFFDLGVTFVDALCSIIHTGVTELLQEIEEGSCELAKTYAKKLSEVGEKVIGNIGMELSKLAPLIGDSAMRDSLLVSDGDNVLDWYEIGASAEPVDVILSLPEEKLSRWEPMIRLMINQLITALYTRPARTYDASELPPLLVMLDEFPRLGSLPDIVDGLSTLRSRGVTFALCVQSLAQLDDRYGVHGRKCILDNCSFKVLLSAADVDTQRYFSSLVGEGDAHDLSISAQYQDPFFEEYAGTSLSIARTRKPYVYPEEFSRLTSVLVVSPEGPFFAKKGLFFKHRKKFLPAKLNRNPEIAVPSIDASHTYDRKDFDDFMQDSKDRIAKQKHRHMMEAKRAQESARKEEDRLYFKVGRLACQHFPDLLEKHGADSDSALEAFDQLFSSMAALSGILTGQSVAFV